MGCLGLFLSLLFTLRLQKWCDVEWISSKCYSQDAESPRNGRKENADFRSKTCAVRILEEEKKNRNIGANTHPHVTCLLSLLLLLLLFSFSFSISSHALLNVVRQTCRIWHSGGICVCTICDPIICLRT